MFGSDGMLGFFEGLPNEKLDQVAALFSTLAPQASCRLSGDGREIVCQAKRIDGETHRETLATDLLPAESVRHAAMRLGKATHLPERIGDWERWASAWHLIQTHGEGAISRADDQIRMLRADGSPSGVTIWEDVRRRVAVLQAEPDVWAGRA